MPACKCSPRRPLPTGTIEASDTWLARYDGGSGLTAPLEVQYLFSIYWALMTLTTVGYGDITPANDSERLYVFPRSAHCSACKCSPRRPPLPHRYALGSLLLGALVFGFMLSSIGGLVKGLDKENIRLQQKMVEVKEFTRWHKMPSDLSSRVRKYDEDH